MQLLYYQYDCTFLQLRSITVTTATAIAVLNLLMLLLLLMLILLLALLMLFYCRNSCYCCFTVRLVCTSFLLGGVRLWHFPLERQTQKCIESGLRSLYYADSEGHLATFIPIPPPSVECHLGFDQNGVICSFSARLLLERIFQCFLMINYVSSDLSDKQSVALFLLFPSRAGG